MRLELATHLAARGIEVHVLVAKRNQEPIEAGLRLNPVPNLHFTYVPVPYDWAKKSEAIHYMCWQLAALNAARELAGRFRFQVAHHVTYASVHVPSQLWRLGIPVVLGRGRRSDRSGKDVEVLRSGETPEQMRSALTKALKWSPLHRHWLKQMSFVLAANQDTLHIVRALGCKNTSLMCDTAISADYFAHGPRSFEELSGAFKLLWVGRMLTRKALPLALDAVREVRQNVTLTIAGDGIDPSVVHQMIRDRNLQHRVFWKGSRLTGTELRTAYAEHDAMLFTSLRDSFGSQVLEAMAMGLPIITLDLHGAHDWVPNDASLKAEVGTPEETVRNFADAIEKYALSMPQKAANVDARMEVRQDSKLVGAR